MGGCKGFFSLPINQQTFTNKPKRDETFLARRGQKDRQRDLLPGLTQFHPWIYCKISTADGEESHCTGSVTEWLNTDCQLTRNVATPLNCCLTCTNYFATCEMWQQCHPLRHFGTRNYLLPSAGPLRFFTSAHCATLPGWNFAPSNCAINSNFCIPHILSKVCTNGVAHNTVLNPNTFLETIFA